MGIGMKKTYQTLVLACCCAGVVGVSPAVAYTDGAQDQEIDELLSLDIEALTVSVASKREEGVKDAPGVINVVTAREIRESGARTLFEVLERQPAVYGLFNWGTGEHANAIRGNSTSSGSSHTLLLLNGRPVREGYTGSIDGFIYRTMPLSMIDHLEIIRGPGSVLYGTNAYAGVINVVTKKAEKSIEGEVSGTYGSYDSVSFEGAAGSKGEDYSVYGGVTVSDNNGWKDTFSDIIGVTDEFQKTSKDYNVVANAKYKNFTLNVMNADTDEVAFGFPSIAPLRDDIFRKQTFIDVGYKHELTENWSASINGSYTKSEQNFPLAAVFDTDDFLTELTLDGKLGEKTNLVVGGTWYRLKGEEKLLQFDYTSHRYAAYAQIDHQFTDWLKLVAGAQINKTEAVDEDISPRLAAIMNFDNNWGAKLMYGQAFRSAYPLEQFVNIPGALVGDPTLDPEKIETVDAQVFYQTKNYYGALTVFRSKETDTIRAGLGTLVNDGVIKSHGGTLEGKAHFGTDWTLEGSVTYLHDSPEAGINGYAMPEWMAKIGATYRGWRGITVNVFDNFAGDLDIANNNPAVNKVPEDYHLITANVIVDLHEFVDGLPTETYLSFYGYNLLDQRADSSYPDNPAVENAGPARPDRTVFGKITFKF